MNTFKMAVGAIAFGAAAAMAAAPAMAQTSVNISIGQPGFYGPLNVVDYGPPALYYPQPVVVQRGFVGAPIYLRVPEGHRKHWSKHCYRYNACGRQVFFVQDSWYNNVYAPRYRERYYRDRPVVREHFYREPHREYREVRREVRREEHRGPDRGHDRGHDRGPDHGPGHDRGGDHGDRGHGNGHGKHGD